MAWRHVQAPWWDKADDLREMQDNMVTGVGYEGVDEYTPVGADPAAVDKDARNVTVAGAAHAAIRVLRLGCGVEEFYGGDVGGGSAGGAVVSVSGVAGGSEWARGGDGSARGARDRCWFRLRRG